jgi:signal transduction histidine kinase
VQCRGQIFCDAIGKVDYISGVTFDVTERRRVEEALKESEKNLRHLAIRLITAQEDERKRLSRELHDELGQSLLVLRLQIGSLEKKLRGEAQVTRADSAAILSYLDGVIDNVRRLSRDLSPYILEDLGLSSALRYLISEFDRHYSIQRCVVDLDEIDHLFFQEAQVNIYRIFQESLTNIGKYAHATQVFIAVKRQGDQVSFVVEDNGLGFNVSQVLTVGGGKGLGLAAMEERVRMLGGTLKIKSREGAGTRISFTLPIEVRAGARFAGQ